MMDSNNLFDDEFEVNHALVQASKETWAKSYGKTPEIHAKLIRNQAKTAKVLRKYFRGLSQRAPDYIDWKAYNQIQADKLNVKILINTDQFFDDEDSEFMNDMYDPIALAAALGAGAAEEVYSIPLGLNGASAAIQTAARGQIAQLIGKKLDKSGNIVNNPNPKYNINETTRDQIEQSIRTSLNLGETQEDATLRLQGILDDPDRAALIANTETVNAYQKGQSVYASETDAVGKEWESSNPDDICGENADAGPIGIDDSYPSGDDEPTAHPNCVCNQRFIYQQEADDEGYDF